MGLLDAMFRVFLPFGRVFNSGKDKGLWYIVKCLFTLLWLRLFNRQASRKGRASPIPQELHPFPTDDDWSREVPRREASGHHHAWFCGSNSSGDYIVVNIIRSGKGLHSRSDVFLRLADGRELVKSVSLDSDHRLSTGSVFEGGGLTLKCHLPDRTWRVSFTGLLSPKSDSENKQLFVKFSFIWKACTSNYSFEEAHNRNLTAQCISESKWNSIFPPVKRVLRHLKVYEKWGHWKGNISIGDEVRPVEMWGPKIRHTVPDIADQITSLKRFYGKMQDGTFFNVSSSCLESVAKSLDLKSGYLIQPDNTVSSIIEGSLPSVESWVNSSDAQFALHFTDESKTYTVEATNLSSHLRICSSSHVKSVHLLKLKCGNVEGQGVLLYLKGDPHQFQRIDIRKAAFPENLGIMGELSAPQVLLLEQPQTICYKLVGKRGASLSALKRLQEVIPKFSVPNGIIVTIPAYASHMDANPHLSAAVHLLELTSREDTESIHSFNIRIKELFEQSDLCDSLKATVHSKLRKLYGDYIDKKEFVVRASPVGEEVEGFQKTEKLKSEHRVKGLNEIYKSILRCWSSQFSVNCILERKNFGQPVSKAIAVIIQEMVPAEITGNIYTSDRTTGNPNKISIVYNESNHNKQSQLKDAHIIVRDAEDNVSLKGVESVSEADSTGKLPEKDATHLAAVALELEKALCGPLELKWAMIGDRVYFFQASYLSKYNEENENELKQELEPPVRNEVDAQSLSNIRNLNPYNLTPLSRSTIREIIDIELQNVLEIHQGHPALSAHPEIVDVVLQSHLLNFTSLLKSIPRISDQERNISRMLQIALFGSHSKGNTIQVIKDSLKTPSSRTKLKKLTSYILDALKLQSELKKTASVVSVFKIPCDRSSSPQELYQEIQKSLSVLSLVFQSYCRTSLVSSLANILVLAALSGKGFDENKVFSDFLKLVRSTEKTCSAEAPRELKVLARKIADLDEDNIFVTLDSEGLETWIADHERIAKKFRGFLRRHGYYCHQKYELKSSTWKMNSSGILKVIQAIVGQIKSSQSESTKAAAERRTESLEVNLSTPRKAALKLLVPLARYGLRVHEESKTLFIKSLEPFRTAYRELGRKMVTEGFLPEAELVFFLTHPEIGKILKERPIALITKAQKRRRMENDSRNAEECTPSKEKRTHKADLEESSEVTGIPASLGTTTGRACCLKSTEHVSEIQLGSIVISPSFDSGMVAHLPLINGLVTKSGGLLSDGPVAAREWNIPCVASAEEAATMFKSGDKVELDGTKGTLKRTEA